MISTFSAAFAICAIHVLAPGSGSWRVGHIYFQLNSRSKAGRSPMCYLSFFYSSHCDFSPDSLWQRAPGPHHFFHFSALFFCLSSLGPHSSPGTRHVSHQSSAWGQEETRGKWDSEQDLPMTSPEGDGAPWAPGYHSKRYIVEIHFSHRKSSGMCKEKWKERSVRAWPSGKHAGQLSHIDGMNNKRLPRCLVLEAPCQKEASGSMAPCSQ